MVRPCAPPPTCVMPCSYTPALPWELPPGDPDFAQSNHLPTWHSLKSGTSRAFGGRLFKDFDQFLAPSRCLFGFNIKRLNRQPPQEPPARQTGWFPGPSGAPSARMSSGLQNVHRALDQLMRQAILRHPQKSPPCCCQHTLI
jgi:hypothetical protein